MKLYRCRQPRNAFLTFALFLSVSEDELPHWCHPGRPALPRLPWRCVFKCVCFCKGDTRSCGHALVFYLVLWKEGLVTWLGDTLSRQDRRPCGFYRFLKERCVSSASFSAIRFDFHWNHSLLCPPFSPNRFLLSPVLLQPLSLWPSSSLHQVLERHFPTLVITLVLLIEIFLGGG